MGQNDGQLEIEKLRKDIQITLKITGVNYQNHGIEQRFALYLLLWSGPFCKI